METTSILKSSYNTVTATKELVDRIISQLDDGLYNLSADCVGFNVTFDLRNISIIKMINDKTKMTMILHMNCGNEIVINLPLDSEYNKLYEKINFKLQKKSVFSLSVDTELILTCDNLTVKNKGSIQIFPRNMICVTAVFITKNQMWNVKIMKDKEVIVEFTNPVEKEVLSIMKQFQYN